jgi:hypothetical protein
MGTGPLQVACDLEREPRTFQAQRLELEVNGRGQFFRRALSLDRQRASRLAIALVRLAGRALQRGKPLSACINETKLLCMARSGGVELIDRHIVFASGSAQREQPLLDSFELMGIIMPRV